MKTKTTITEITQEDLVNLFSTATFGSGWLAAHVQHSTRCLLDIRLEDSREDVWAKALLAGYPIILTDYQAEGEKYGENFLCFEGEDAESAEYMIYRVDVTRGLQAALDGTFNGAEDEDTARFAASALLHLMREDCEFDADEADALVQIIMFNEIVYY